MITKSIYATGSKGHHKFTLNVQEDSTSISDNSSLLSFKFIISATNSTWQWRSYPSISYSITIGTNTYTGTITNFNGNTTTLKNVSEIEITHDSDGTKTIPISFSVVDPNSVNYTCGNANESSTMTLTDLHTPPQITNLVVQELNSDITSVGEKVVKYLSHKRFTITAIAYDNATITKYRVYNGTELLIEKTSTVPYPNVLETFLGSVELQTIKINLKDYAMLAVEVEDSMGGVTRYGPYNRFEVIEYQKPNIITTSSNVQRIGQSTGEVKLNLSATFKPGTIGSKINSRNTMSMRFAYWQKGQTESTDYYDIDITSQNEDVSVVGNNLTITNWQMEKNGSTIQDVGSQAYYFKFKFTDAFNYTSTVTLLCSASEYLMCKFFNRVDFKKITEKNKEVALKGESIFHSDNGDNTDITFSKTPYGYSIMEIIGTDHNARKSVYHRIANPTENDEFDLISIEAGASNTYIQRTRYTLVGNEMRVSRGGHSTISSNSASTTVGTNYIYITDVIIYE